MIKKILILIFLVYLTSGCSVYHINSEDISSNYYPSKKTAKEIIYVENIDKPHEIIGFVTVNTERRQSISAVIEKMKRESAILGGDIITDIKTNATGTWKKLPAQQVIGNAYVRADFTATIAILK